MKIQRAESFAEILQLLEEYFEKCPGDRFGDACGL